MKKRTVKKIFLVPLLLLPLIGVAHYFIFPEETNCILISMSGMSRSDNIYHKNDISPEKIDHIKKIESAASKKINAFWNSNSMMDYKIIYCDTEKRFDRYAPHGVPAATHLKMGAYIVIKDESIDENIIAHEISHTVLYRNIGWFNRTFEIPVWFDEGLAMQVDDRDYYSIDSLLAKQRAGKILPDVTKLIKPADFFAGDHETIMLNYSTAKYVVHEWLKVHSLKQFIASINSGSTFKKAYQLN